MRNIVFSFFAMIVLLYGCGANSNETATSDSSATVVNLQPADTSSLVKGDTMRLKGRWNLIPAMASDTATGKLPYLVFDAGRISGNTGCNSFSSSYTSSGTSLSFEAKMISTRMACAGYDENAFVKNLLRTNNYDTKGDTLILKTDATPLSYWLKGKE